MTVALILLALPPMFEAAAVPAFVGTQAPISAAIKERVVGSSWREGCPVPLEDLAYLKVKHHGYDGNVHDGELIVGKDVAAEVLEAFRELYAAEFLIEQMKLVDEYGADDDRSMEANNTSAFNCRSVYGKPGVYSKHSYGRAIDINPKINPYVTKKMIAPKGGEAYTDRTQAYPGIIVQGNVCHQAFTKRGWKWGGAWRSLKDYQHFEKKKAKPKK